MLMRAVLAGCVACSIIAGSPLSARQTSDEYDVKAAFLLNLARFVEWPPSIEALPDRFTICIYGDDPFGPVLDRSIDGQTIRGREVRLRRLDSAESATLCRIAFVRAEEVRKSEELIAAVRGAHVLVVGERTELLEMGGVVQLVTRDRRVRIVINKEAADKAGLEISSKLMALADVHDD
jgi:hypothetical protein